MVPLVLVDSACSCSHLEWKPPCFELTSRCEKFRLLRPDARTIESPSLARRLLAARVTGCITALPPSPATASAGSYKGSFYLTSFCFISLDSRLSTACSPSNPAQPNTQVGSRSVHTPSSADLSLLEAAPVNSRCLYSLNPIPPSLPSHLPPPSSLTPRTPVPVLRRPPPLDLQHPQQLCVHSSPLSSHTH